MDGTEKQPKKQKTAKTYTVNWNWVITIMAVSLVLSASMSYVSSEVLGHVGTITSFVVLFLIIALGVLFDMIGIAATAATEKEFHSMAAKKVKGAREAVWMTKNAEKVGSICNDVVGDICGIISGATGALITANITRGFGVGGTIAVTLVITGLIAAVTIGGKAAGKGIGIANSGSVLFICGRILSVLPFFRDKK